jgi:hydrogenase-4 component F
MRKMAGTFRLQPVWGVGLFGSLLSLIGMAPFALFLSEFLIAKAAVEKGAFWSLFIFLLGAGVVFVGALGHAIPLFWGKPERELTPFRSSVLEKFLSLAPLMVLLFLGIFMPHFLREALVQASTVIQTRGVDFSALYLGGKP